MRWSHFRVSKGWTVSPAVSSSLKSFQWKQVTVQEARYGNASFRWLRLQNGEASFGSRSPLKERKTVINFALYWHHCDHGAIMMVAYSVRQYIHCTTLSSKKVLIKSSLRAIIYRPSVTRRGTYHGTMHRKDVEQESPTKSKQQSLNNRVLSEINR